MPKRRYRRSRPTTNERQIAAVDRFSAAIAGGMPEEINAATGDLLEQFADTAQRLVTQAILFLVEAQKTDREMMAKMREQLVLHQRHFEQVDLVLDEQARERAIGE